MFSLLSCLDSNRPTKSRSNFHRPFLTLPIFKFSYIITYFGETKAAKQFHQEFLTKRIELRPKRDAKKEDDLSAPAQAIDTGVAPSSSGTKKKTKKAKQVDVSDLMSFRAVGGNRFNAGEIDTDIPMSTKKGGACTYSPNHHHFCVSGKKK